MFTYLGDFVRQMVQFCDYISCDESSKRGYLQLLNIHCSKPPAPPSDAIQMRVLYSLRSVLKCCPMSVKKYEVRTGKVHGQARGSRFFSQRRNRRLTSGDPCCKIDQQNGTTRDQKRTYHWYSASITSIGSFRCFTLVLQSSNALASSIILTARPLIEVCQIKAK